MITPQEYMTLINSNGATLPLGRLQEVLRYADYHWNGDGALFVSSQEISFGEQQRAIKLIDGFESVSHDIYRSLHAWMYPLWAQAYQGIPYEKQPPPDAVVWSHFRSGKAMTTLWGAGGMTSSSMTGGLVRRLKVMADRLADVYDSRIQLNQLYALDIDNDTGDMDEQQKDGRRVYRRQPKYTPPREQQSQSQQSQSQQSQSQQSQSQQSQSQQSQSQQSRSDKEIEEEVQKQLQDTLRRIEKKEAEANDEEKLRQQLERKWRDRWIKEQQQSTGRTPNLMGAPNTLKDIEPNLRADILDVSKELKKIVSAFGKQVTPRMDYPVVARLVKTMRSPYQARQEEAGHPKIVFMPDTSPSCEHIARITTALSAAASTLGQTGADIWSMSHPNGDVFQRWPDNPRDYGCGVLKNGRPYMSSIRDGLPLIYGMSPSVYGPKETARFIWKLKPDYLFLLGDEDACDLYDLLIPLPFIKRVFYLTWIPYHPEAATTLEAWAKDTNAKSISIPYAEYVMSGKSVIVQPDVMMTAHQTPHVGDDISDLYGRASTAHNILNRMGRGTIDVTFRNGTVKMGAMELANQLLMLSNHSGWATPRREWGQLWGWERSWVSEMETVTPQHVHFDPKAIYSKVYGIWNVNADAWRGRDGYYKHLRERVLRCLGMAAERG